MAYLSVRGNPPVPGRVLKSPYQRIGCRVYMGSGHKKSGLFSLKNDRLLLIILLLLTTLPRCDWIEGKPQSGIVVGSRHISLQEVKADLEFISSGMDLGGKQFAGIKEKWLEQIIDHYLIMEYGKVNGITLTETELQADFKAIKAEYSEEAFEDALLRGYVDIEKWKKWLKEKLLVEKIVKTVTENIEPPSHQEIRRYFEKNRDEFTAPQMIRFRQIVTRTQKEAEEVLKKIRSGEDMGRMAKQYSIAPEAENGGVVEWVARGDLEISMASALFSLSPGEISPVVKTPHGYHIFQALSIRPRGIKTLPEVMEQIESKLLRQNRERFLVEWLEGLRNRFEVKVGRNLMKELEIS